MAADDFVSRRAAGFLLVARIGMASLFLFSGSEKLLDLQGAMGFARAYHVPLPQLAIPLSIVLELGCGIGLLIPRICRYAAAVLAVWMFILNPWFHQFWAVPPAEWQMMIDNFFHHFVMIGGMMYIVVFGAGAPAKATELGR